MTKFRVQGSSLKVQLPAIIRWSLVFILCLLPSLAGGSTAIAGNRCKDRCNDAYQLRKDVCRAIPLKHERKSCEKAAKHSKDHCKHNCR